MEKIGPYTLERKLGSGGMGTVYLARSRGGRQVAVKVARAELAEDSVFRERFRTEVAAARRVGGFHTAPVVDADPEASPPWLATAYIKGPTLTKLIEDSGPMDEDGARMLGAALAEALSAIHACGIIHRDLKPGNILMADDGPRVVDFGIARAVEATALTVTGATFGTPGFLAPEQALGEVVGSPADVFALGAVLVTVLGGSPFGDGSPMALIYRSVHEEPDLSRVPSGLRSAVEGCLAKRPSARPTPDQLLELFVAPRVAPTVVPGGYERFLRPPGRPGEAAGDGARPFFERPESLPDAPSMVAPSLPGTGAHDSAVPGALGAPHLPQQAADTGPSGPAHLARTGRGPGGIADAADGERDTGGTAAGESHDAPPAAEFAAADAKYAVDVDAWGFHIMLDDVELDFPWHEISRVEHGRVAAGRQYEIVLRFHNDVPYSCRLHGAPEDFTHWHDGLQAAVAAYLREG